jgi:hypothetical protein
MDRLTRRLGYHLMVVDGVSDDVSPGSQSCLCNARGREMRLCLAQL